MYFQFHTEKHYKFFKHIFDITITLFVAQNIFSLIFINYYCIFLLEIILYINKFL